jgi:hypothetical protein
VLIRFSSSVQALLVVSGHGKLESAVWFECEILCNQFRICGNWELMPNIASFVDCMNSSLALDCSLADSDHVSIRSNLASSGMPTFSFMNDLIACEYCEIAVESISLVAIFLCLSVCDLDFLLFSCRSTVKSSN